MATIVLGVVGSFFGPIGTAIGVAIGSYIDSQFLFPALFGPGDTNIRGPRIEDIRIMTAGAGSRMHYCMGPKNRLGGHVIYASDVREVKKDTPQGGGGGKGGGSPTVTVTTYEYFMDVGIGLCERPFEGSINKLQRIWADGKTVYNDKPDLDIDAQITATQKGGGFLVPIYLSLSMPSTDSPNFSSLRVGSVATLSGFGPPNDGVYVVRYVRPAIGGFIEAAFNNILAVDQAIGQRQVLQVIPPFDPSKFSNINIHRGSSSQNPDAIIEADLGVGETPGYRLTSYFVLKDLFLGHYGNRLPRLEGQVIAHLEPYTYQEAISAILRRAGISPSFFDVSGVDPDKLLRGFAVAGPHHSNKLLEPLLLAGKINVRKSDGTLVFYDLEAEIEVGVDPAVLAPYDEGADPPPRLRVHDVSDEDLPTQITIRFIDKNNAIQDGSRDFQFINRRADSTEQFDIPITLGNGEAFNLGRDILVRLWNERQSGDVVLPPSMIGISEGVELDATIGGEGFKIRILEVTRGADNYIHECKGILTEATDIDPDGPGDPDDDDDDDIYLPPFVLLAIMDAPAFVQEHTTIPGFYYGMAAADILAEWIGGSLWKSLTAGGSYVLLDTNAVEGAIVEVISVLAIGPIGVIDRTNTVDVEIIEGTLASVTETEMISGSNRMWLGKELIGFQTVTALAGANQYRLSNLLRGLRNTEDGISNAAGVNQHTVFELGIFLGGTVRFLDIDPGVIGQTLYYKALAEAGDLDDQNEIALVHNGRNVQCFSPGHLLGSWSTNDLDLRWTRRTRAFYSTFSGNPLPQIPTIEQYNIDLLDKTTGLVSKSFENVVATTLTIVSADLTAAGYSAQESPDIDIVQLGEIAGSGVPNHARPVLIRQL